MSEQSTNSLSITSSVKEKDPHRVAPGKRLGAISKQAKEAKRLEQQAQIHLIFRWWISLGGNSVLPIPKQRQPTIPEEEEPPPKRKSKRIFDE